MQVVRYRYAKHQADALTEATEDWKYDHNEAMAVRDIEDVLTNVRVLVGLMERVQESAFQDLQANKVTNVDDDGKSPNLLFQMAGRAIQLWYDVVTAYSNRGFEIEGKAQFQQDRSYLETLFERQVKRWPRTNVAELDVSLSNDPDSVVDAEELLREIQSQD